MLLAVVCASAVAMVESKHHSRGLFVELQQLERERDALNVDWGRLRLEQGTHATHGSIEQRAREERGLRQPDRDSIKVLRIEPLEREDLP